MAGNADVDWRASLVADLEGDVLEIGVGEGENLAYYQRATHVWGIEPHAKRAAAARRAAAEVTIPVTVDVAPAERLPYPNQSFDHVVSSLVFCSVNDPQQALAEIARVLRPGGALHMVEHVRPDNFMLKAGAILITPLWSKLAWNCHLDRPTVQTLEQAGWSVRIYSRRLVFVHLTARPPAAEPAPAPQR